MTPPLVTDVPFAQTLTVDGLLLHDCGNGPGVNHVYSDRVCARCGHPPCPCCYWWCDLTTDDAEQCCDGACDYGDAEPRLFVLVDGKLAPFEASDDD